MLVVGPASRTASTPLFIAPRLPREAPRASLFKSGQPGVCRSGKEQALTRAQHFPRQQRGLLLCQASAGRSDLPHDSPRRGLEQRLGELAGQTASLFPLWLLLATFLALARPAAFAWFERSWVTPSLALMMTAMGTTLSVEDFRAIGRRPQLVFIGALLQFTIMPAMGYLASRLFSLPQPCAVGVCLVSACPGGLISNVICYLAKADVPLSVAMTTVSTLAAVVLTPAITRLLLGQVVPVDVLGLLVSTLQVVLVPIVSGAFLQNRLPGLVQRAAPFLPLTAALTSILVSCSVLASSASAVLSAGWDLLGAVATLHAGGFFLGYVSARLLGVGEVACRTISIEVGMQNSALGSLLAMLHFSDPLTAVPGGVSACTHSLLGSLLGGVWRASVPREESSPQTEIGSGGPVLT